MMNGVDFTLAGAQLVALGERALWWPDARLLAAGDLHLGKAGRAARLGGALLPPYETADTLDRLDALINALGPRTVVLLGDSFDDIGAAEELSWQSAERLQRMASGRRWIWIAGNHDPIATDLPGTHLAAFREGPLTFRHIAEPGAAGEVSAHYHPKARIVARGQRFSRPCFLADAARVILPAFGTYTGGLDITSPALSALMAPDAVAILTGRRAVPVRAATPG